MSRQQRLTFLAIAAVIAIVAVVVLAGGSDDEPETAATTPTPTATATASPDATAEATETAEPTPEPTPDAPLIEIEGGEVKGGVSEIRAEAGDTVRFSVTSDAADEVHVHGYDVKKDVEAGGTARFSFKATIPGIFEIELEGSHLQIASLRVEQ
jgi:FtsP/CotA-like multicopper oxidase with cupredoxin domain